MTPWEVIFRAAVIYLVLIGMLRLAGRKELSRYSVFDVALLFLVTVAARESIVASDTSLTTAVVALGTLVLLDGVMGRIGFHSHRFKQAVAGPRVELVRQGRLIPEGLQKTHVSENDLRASLRDHGTDDLGEVSAAYMEQSGRITFVFHHR